MNGGALSESLCQQGHYGPALLFCCGTCAAGIICIVLPTCLSLPLSIILFPTAPMTRCTLCKSQSLHIHSLLYNSRKHMHPSNPSGGVSTLWILFAVAEATDCSISGCYDSSPVMRWTYRIRVHVTGICTNFVIPIAPAIVADYLLFGSAPLI